MAEIIITEDLVRVRLEEARLALARIKRGAQAAGDFGFHNRIVGVLQSIAPRALDRFMGRFTQDTYMTGYVAALQDVFGEENYGVFGAARVLISGDPAGINGEQILTGRVGRHGVGYLPGGIH